MYNGVIKIGKIQAALLFGYLCLEMLAWMLIEGIHNFWKLTGSLYFCPVWGFLIFDWEGFIKTLTLDWAEV